MRHGLERIEFRLSSQIKMIQVTLRLAVKMMMILVAVVGVVKAHLIAKVIAVKVMKVTLSEAQAKKETRMVKKAKA